MCCTCLVAGTFVTRERQLDRSSIVAGVLQHIFCISVRHHLINHEHHEDAAGRTCCREAAGVTRGPCHQRARTCSAQCPAGQRCCSQHHRTSVHRQDRPARCSQQVSDCYVKSILFNTELGLHNKGGVSSPECSCSCCCMSACECRAAVGAGLPAWCLTSCLFQLKALCQVDGLQLAA
jgi:hypothetical protein